MHHLLTLHQDVKEKRCVGINVQEKRHSRSPRSSSRQVSETRTGSSMGRMRLKHGNAVAAPSQRTASILEGDVQESEGEIDDPFGLN